MKIHLKSKFGRPACGTYWENMKMTENLSEVTCWNCRNTNIYWKAEKEIKNSKNLEKTTENILDEITLENYLENNAGDAATSLAESWDWNNLIQKDNVIIQVNEFNDEPILIKYTIITEVIDV